MARKADYSGIRPDVKNANKGTERGRYMVEASLRETGAGRSILLDKDGRIIAGNKTFEAASDIGLPVRVVETDGTELVAVKRTDLDLDDDTGTARRLAYYDNRAAQVGLDWDAEQMLADLGAGLDLSAMFKQDELDELLADLQPKGTEGDTPAEVDRAEELRQKWSTAPGQLWSLDSGNGHAHRLICGDCTDAATVARVMGGERAQAVVTDPPYGIDLETDTTERTPTTPLPGKQRALHDHAKIINDDEPFDRRRVPIEAPEEFWFGADYYVDTLPNYGKDGSWLVWDKRKEGALDEMRGNAFELCWSKRKHRRELLRVTWIGVLGHNKAEDGDSKVHPTQKPVKLISCILTDYTDAGAIVVDAFAGSGVVGMACEILGRRARMIEIDPNYCAVILERWSVHTGRQPVLVDI